MKLSTSLVAVKKITCKALRSQFSDDDIEKAANSILEVEGVVTPIIVRRTSLQSYEVIDGNFEYYAAERAREINPRKGEMIGVYIIDDENEDVLSKQVELFRKQKSTGTKQSEIKPETLELFLNNLESRIDKLAKQLLEENKDKYKLELEIKELQNKLEQNASPLYIFNKFEQSKLLNKLIKTGIPEKTAQKIAQAIVNERTKNPFESLQSIIEKVKYPYGKKMQRAINEERMIKIIDSWSEN